ncbi:hypothetical protein EYR40_004350 [Pleurotus pulmonarius]|nr:hypothetical protein EYR40_004350 [Pleurotus pulmonarius]KAF4607054.1 hypothetical protein EYR38_001111 [Pleurotus pulmonarius]
MGIVEKFPEEMARSEHPRSATEYHLGLLKAKLARYRAQLLEPASKSGPAGTGFDVQKSGDARVALIGFPSVGKSTLLSKVTHTQSETAAYEFTTLTAIPGVIEYKGARIQLLDLPGIVEGASQGRGRGRQVVSTAKTADLILIMMDATKSDEHRRLLEVELDAVGIRLNKSKPDVVFKRRTTGGFNTTVKLTKTDERTIRLILASYKLHNCDVMIREDITTDEFIDVLIGTRKYMPCLYVYNKVDAISLEQLDKISREPHSVVISCEMDLNIDYLIDRIWDELALVKIYTKKRGAHPDLSDPICLRKGATIENVCNGIHRSLAANFRYALVWGKSSKFSPHAQKTISYTKEGAVAISYPTLVSEPLSLGASIEEAFGSHPKSLGIIIVRDLPPQYQKYRERLLKLAHSFATLPESVREKYADPATKYSFGWSHGKEIMNGKPDLLKGSYYANPVADKPTVSSTLRTMYPEYYGNNIWPEKEEKGVEGFEEAFKDLGGFVLRVGYALAAACQPFALSHLRDTSVSLPDIIANSQTTKARLLHYFPPAPGTAPKDDEPVDNWCGFHLDHSILTGLCSAMFLEQGANGAVKVVPSPSPSSGLYIRTRGGDLTKVTIPPDCLAFQTGEALQLATGGKLRATPHCVRVGGSANAESISRETFALFMQPEVNQQLSPTQTFGEFSKRVFDEHYSEDSMSK